MRSRRQRRPSRQAANARGASPPTQLERVREVMLASGKYGLWLTLRQLARRTGYGEASISAQLRHLRKGQYGGFVLEKRCCNVGRIGGSRSSKAMWEYQLRR